MEAAMYRTGKYVKQLCKGYSPDDTRLVEVAGYRSTQAMVTEFIQAGAKLVSARQEYYDWPSGVTPPSDASPVRTRAKNYDMADFSKDARTLADRIKFQKEQREIGKKSQQELSEKQAEDEKKSKD